MATNPFPPQAYTRDTLIKAFEWLQTQSPQVRELATTNDLLISLYTKALMQGKDAHDLPQLASFKNELRSLAGQIGKFEEEPPAAAPAGAGAPAAAPRAGGTGPSTPATSANAAPSAGPAASPTTSAPPTSTTPLTNSVPAAPQGTVHMTSRAVAPAFSVQLDPKSLAWLEEIQRELNLESPAEALRLAVSVGYGRLSELFPKRR